MTKSVILGSPAVLHFIPTGSGPSVVVSEGNQVALSVSVSQVGTTGVYSASFVPEQTGYYSVFALGTKVGDVEVVERPILDYLQNLEEEALGRWEWNKTSKAMTLYRRDGTVLGEYLLDDTLESAYRRLA